MSKTRLGADPLKWITSTKDQEEVIKTLPSKKQIEKITGRPGTNTHKITKSSQSGLPEGWTRATFIVKETTLKKLKDLVYTERSQLKITVNKALESFIEGKKIIKRKNN